MKRRAGPVLVGFGFASGASGSISAKRDLRSYDDQGEADDRRCSKGFSQENHSIKEREDRRQVVTERGPFLPDLGDKRVVEQEGDRRTDKAEEDHRHYRPRSRFLAGRGEEGHGGHSTAPTPSEKRLVLLGGTPLSLYCSLTIKLERAPQAAAVSIASAPKNWPSELTDWTPTTKATPSSPMMRPTI
jgi:hypothetical protein